MLGFYEKDLELVLCGCFEWQCSALLVCACVWSMVVVSVYIFDGFSPIDGMDSCSQRDSKLRVLCIVVPWAQSMFSLMPPVLCHQ